MDMELEDDMFIVDEIIDQRIRNGKLQYFVKWQGYPDPEDNTWEPAENLSSCPTVVEAFETKLKEKEDKRRKQTNMSTVSSAPASKSVVTSTPIRPANAKLAKAVELEKSELDGKKKSTKPPEHKDRIRKDSSSKKDRTEMNNNEPKSKSGVGEVPLNAKKSDSKKSLNEHKKTTSKESTKAKETNSKSDRLADGFDKKLEAEKIIAVTKHEGKMVFLVKFKNTNVCYVISKHRVYKHAPLIALKFFENKISWINE